MVSDRLALIEGRRVAYSRVTSADEPQIVLLHGLAADRRGLMPIAEHLPRADVVALDLPGFGDSEALRWHSPAAYARVVEGLCVELNLAAPILVGHSFGATVALTHAALFPRRARAVALLMPVVADFGPVAWSARAYFGLGSRLPERLARWWFLNQLVVRLSDQLNFVTPDHAVRKRIMREDLRTAAMASPRAIQEFYWGLQATPFVELARRVRARTVVVSAIKDGLSTPAAAAELGQRISGSSIVTAGGAGHLWPVEAPATVARLLQRSVLADDW